MWENHGNEAIFYGWALIFKTRSSHNQETGLQPERKNFLKNKIKLLEFENQLLKCDVCNKQKFIETLLDVMSHDIDVAPASSITYDYHVTSEPQHIRENQNCETAILIIMTDGNVIINRIMKIKKAMIIIKKKRNPNKITHQQAQIIKRVIV